MLANIYLHYVFDLWTHQWRGKQAKGEVLITRYADDAVLCFQYEWEARRYLSMLKTRLKIFGLAVHPDKTRLIRFGRFAAKQRVQRNEKKTKSFDFLGFTHYCTTRNCTTRRNGEFKVGRKTMRKKFVKQIQIVQLGLRKRMHDSIGETLKWLRSVLTGHMNYYSVPGNLQSVSKFHNAIIRRWLKMLRRRSQRHRIIWKNFGQWVIKYLPKVRIVHSYPEMRFLARYSK